MIYRHPEYKDYGANKDGQIYSYKSGKPKELTKVDMETRRKVRVANKLETCARFIWECFNGKIKKGYIIYHIDNDYKNDELANLGIRTKSQHQKIVMEKRWHAV